MRVGAAECEDEGSSEGRKLEFQLNAPSHYFKSSFARAVLSDSKGPRSLDAAVLAGCRSQDYRKGPATFPLPPPPPLDDEDSQLQKPSGGIRSQSCEVARIWKLKQTPSSPPPQPPPPPPKGRSARGREAATCTAVDSPPLPVPPRPASAAEMDAQRLKKECRGLLDENRRLQGVLEAARGTTLVLDAARLQSQVDTLAWQLKQTETSRQTYRKVMEQVVKFLERTHKSLHHLQQSSPPNGSSVCNTSTPNGRVPRSRSVHTVDVSPSRASPCSNSMLHFPRAKSIAQIEETQNYSTFRDFTWRRPRKVNTDPDTVSPEKLSEESFRLLRLVQSLLNIQEPDLTQRISTVSDTASVRSSDHLPDAYMYSISQRNSTTSSGLDMVDDKGSVLDLHSYASKKQISRDSPASLKLLRSSPSTCRIHSSPDNISIHSIHSNSSKNLEYKNTSLTSGLESGFAGQSNTSRKNRSNTSSVKKGSELPDRFTANGMSSKQQLSEDESGFSSMNSFQDVGVPIINPPPPLPSSSPPSGSHQEVGLPFVENQTPTESPSINHRRCSSTPVSRQSLTVLWV